MATFREPERPALQEEPQGLPEELQEASHHACWAPPTIPRLNHIDEICRVSVKRRARALRLISLAGSRSGLVGLLTVTHPLPSDTPGGRVGLCRGQRPPFRGRCAGGWGDVTHYLAG